MSQLISLVESKAFEFLLPPLCVLFRPLTDWIMPILIGEGNSLTESMDSKANFIQKSPHTPRNNV